MLANVPAPQAIGLDELNGHLNPIGQIWQVQSNVYM